MDEQQSGDQGSEADRNGVERRCMLVLGLLCVTGIALAQSEVKLTASDAAAYDYFGRAVSLYGDTAVIGAPFDDDAGSSSGSAYVFYRNQGGADAWGEVVKLTASDAAPSSLFGYVLSVSGDTVVIGAHIADGAAGSDQGFAYVFQRNGGGADAWGEVVKLSASDATPEDHFGISVSVYGDTAVIGAYRNDDDGTNSGSAYVFHGAPIPVELQRFSVE